MRDLFINQCMVSVRQDYTEEYKRLSEQLRMLSAEELYKKVITHIKRKSGRYKTELVDGIMFTNLLTSGCPRWVQNGQVTGCSFCNYVHELMPQITMMSVLKEKSRHYYDEAVVQSFILLRVNNKTNAAVEGITGFDNFNTDEVPESVLESISEIIEANDHIKPFQYIFESRASSISLEKLTGWKNKIKRRASIELGIETSDEWLRNHWFNKDISNKQVEEAVISIKKVGWKTSGNILLGIPGLTVDQSVSSFFASVKWLKQLNFDHIIFSPLTRKVNTLQDILYRLKDKKRLRDMGIVYGEQTGNLPVTVLMEVIIRMEEENSRLFKDIFISPISWHYYKKGVLGSERGRKNRTFLNKAFAALEEYFTARSLSVISGFISQYRNTEEYMFYNRMGSDAGGKTSKTDCLRALGEEITGLLWPGDYNDRVEAFNRELQNYTENRV